MVPKLHKKGSSFKGAATYLLHDKGRAKSSHRVSWTQTRNLAVHDPQVAWRIMAATAIDQERLKEQAGIKATGRKSHLSVLHLTLAWHPEEKDTLTREDMKRAATGAIRALGAEDHQILIIAHNDEDHPHIHILINRVNPHDGRMLSSSKEKLELSRWAEEYEKERGKIYCEERVANNKARSQGEYRRGDKDQHRLLFEEIKKEHQSANDNRTEAERIRERQRRIDAEISQKGRELTEKHSEEWRALSAAFETKKASLDSKIQALRDQIMQSAKGAHRDIKNSLKEKQRLERAVFERREDKSAGRLKNIKGAFQSSTTQNGKQQSGKLGRLFKILVSRSERQRKLLERQKSEMRALETEQRLRRELLQQRIEQTSNSRYAQASAKFLSDREKLVESQAQERRSLQRRWRARHNERRQDWHNMTRKTGPKEKAKSNFSDAASGLTPDKQALKEEIRRKLLADRSKGRDGPER